MYQLTCSLADMYPHALGSRCAVQRTSKAAKIRGGNGA